MSYKPPPPARVVNVRDSNTQRLTKTVAVTSDINGMAVFQFETVPLGTVWEGTVQIINAPAQTISNISILDDNWGTFYGSGPFGPVQMYGMESLKVTATFLPANTLFLCRLIGFTDDEWNIDPLYPVALQTPVSPFNLIVLPATTVNIANGAIGDFPTVYVGNLASIMCIMVQDADVDTVWTFRWASSIANFSSAATRSGETNYAKNFGNAAPKSYVRHAVLAPYFKMHLSNQGAVSTNCTLTILGIPQGASGLPFQGSPLITFSSNVPANSSTLVVPSFFMPGNAHLWAISGSTSWNIQIAARISNGWQIIEEVGGVANSILESNLILPSSDLLITLANTATSAFTFTMALTAQMV